jgi:hypothetical protein
MACCVETVTGFNARTADRDYIAMRGQRRVRGSSRDRASITVRWIALSDHGGVQEVAATATY